MNGDVMSPLEGEQGFKTQQMLWGYVVQGDICEPSAVIAEDKNVAMIVPDAWDHDVTWLNRQLVSHGDENYHRPPEYWCLPAVAGQRIARWLAVAGASTDPEPPAHSESSSDVDRGSV